MTAGRYQLHVQTNTSDPQKSISTEIPLDVGGEIDGLEVELGALSVVDVAFHGVPEEDAGLVSVLLRSADRNGTFRGVAAAREGAHTFAPIPAGRYWLDVKTAPSNCLSSVKLGDRQFGGSTFDVSAARSCISM